MIGNPEENVGPGIETDWACGKCTNLIRETQEVVADPTFRCPACGYRVMLHVKILTPDDPESRMSNFTGS
jgi:DNA-directed RNA polymerase subunit RPC12/RpoP